MAHTVLCLSSKNSLENFVNVVKSTQDFKSLISPFLTDTKLHVHIDYKCAQTGHEYFCYNIKDNDHNQDSFDVDTPGQGNQIGRFIGIWATFKAFGNN